MFPEMTIQSKSAYSAALQGRGAFTLLEVILALAILAGALASLGEVVRLSGENASAARDLTTAQLLAASKMAEITSGAMELAAAERKSLETETDLPWLYSVDWEPTFEEDLIAVQVTVVQDLPDERHPVKFTLVRWMPDPDAIRAPSSSVSGSTDGAAESAGR